jgi:OmpA-OmpF porin, OOP family
VIPARSGFAALVAAGALAALSQAAWAEDGWYLSGGAGINIVDETDNAVGGLDNSTDYDAGPVFGVSAGRAFGNGLRLELEYDYRGNMVDTVASAPATGKANVNAILANILYSFPTGGNLVPFLGAGVGYGWMGYRSLAPIAGSSLDDTDSGFAYQVIAGVERRIDENLSANLSYRYFSMPDTNFTTAAGAGVNSDYTSHAIMVGLRWSFGAPRQMAQAEPAPAPAPMPAPPPRAEPAPAPMPAPAPAQPRRFIIFFDWNQATLTADARNVLASAATAAKQGQVVRIELTGHADRSGPAPYNMRLSQRRADSAKAQLVRDGIAANEIVTVAKGESEPLVPTADGVREPQNRRVEIVFVNR